jgi:hypothetical protein
MATERLGSCLRLASSCIGRASDNYEQACFNAIAREYTAKQLAGAAAFLTEAQAILVEHGCTIDLEAGVIDATPTRVPGRQCPHCKHYFPWGGA